MEMRVRSSAFTDGGMIPEKYTCDGEGISPPIVWESVSDNIRSFALICEDPDAPMGTFTHWVVYDLPSDVTELPEHIPNKDRLPNGGLQGINSLHKTGYFGPCPPSGTHRYFFKVYALDKKLDIGPSADKDRLMEAMKGHIVAQGQIMGKYQRR